jgi:hypothetical protein
MSKLVNLIIYLNQDEVNHLKSFIKATKGIADPDDHDVEILLSEQISDDINDTTYGDRYEH